jgi:hypothetical protein
VLLTSASSTTSSASPTTISSIAVRASARPAGQQQPIHRVQRQCGCTQGCCTAAQWLNWVRAEDKRLNCTATSLAAGEAGAAALQLGACSCRRPDFDRLLAFLDVQSIALRQCCTLTCAMPLYSLHALPMSGGTGVCSPSPFPLYVLSTTSMARYPLELPLWSSILHTITPIALLPSKAR